MIRPKFHGTNPILWIGVVEDRDDSKAADGHKLGRCRVRVLGYHSAQTTPNDNTGEGIPVDKLHWAYPISSLDSASMNGIGKTPIGVVEGTWVFGFSMDGSAMQDLYIFGTLLGVPKEKPRKGQGFRDPNDDRGDRPNGPYPLDDFLEESDINRLARAEKLNETILQDKKDQRELGIRSARGGSWNEPEPPYSAKYPYNKVKETESGHIEEWDDTKDHERYHRYHKSGTFVEWGPDGDEVRKVIGDGYEIHLKDRNALIKGTLNITVNGDAKILTKGNAYVESDGNIDLSAKKKISMWSLRGIDIQTLGKVRIFGLFGVDIGAVLGRATMGSPVNVSQITAKAVG